jgi:hypothetical protein
MLENIKQAISEDFIGWHVKDVEFKEENADKTLQELSGGKLEKNTIFVWKGLAKDWREYSDHMMKDFMKYDEDVRIKLWSK